jgi:hypothetical protein
VRKFHWKPVCSLCRSGDCACYLVGSAAWGQFDSIRVLFFIDSLFLARSHGIPATGESVPQMKEALTHAAAPASTTGTTSPASVPSDAAEGVDLSNLSANKSDKSEASNAPAGSDKLDMNGLNRVNVLFSGCSFVTVDGMCDKTKPGESLL